MSPQYNPQYNGDHTLVAIRYYQTVQHMITCTSKRQYAFVVQANICMAWVAIEDADYFIHLKGGCCGQKKEGVYSYANESSVRRWTNKGGE